MKKITVLMILILIVSILSSCNLLLDKYLLVTEAIKFSSIEYITIKDNKNQDVKITNSEDYSFLEGYYYTSDFDSSSRMSELNLFPSTRKVSIVLKNNNKDLLILRTGEIVIESSNGKYQTYKTSDDVMNSDAILTLLKKYNGFVE